MPDDIWEKARQYDKVWAECLRLRELVKHLKERNKLSEREIVKLTTTLRKKKKMATTMTRAQVITLSSIILHQLDIGSEVAILGNDNYGGVIVGTPRGHYTLGPHGGHILRDHASKDGNACKSVETVSEVGTTIEDLTTRVPSSADRWDKVQRVLEDGTIAVDWEIPDE